MSNITPEVFFESPPKWQGAIGALAALSVFFIFVYFGLEGAGKIAAVSVASIGAAVRISWPLRHNAWFWAAITIIVAIHVAIVMLYPWSNERYPAFTLIPIMIADIVVLLCGIALLAKMMGASNRA